MVLEIKTILIKKILQNIMIMISIQLLWSLIHLHEDDISNPCHAPIWNCFSTFVICQLWHGLCYCFCWCKGTFIIAAFLDHIIRVSSNLISKVIDFVSSKIFFTWTLSLHSQDELLIRLMKCMPNGHLFHITFHVYIHVIESYNKK